jgi:hypothetical protein
MHAVMLNSSEPGKASVLAISSDKNTAKLNLAEQLGSMPGNGKSTMSISNNVSKSDSKNTLIITSNSPFTTAGIRINQLEDVLFGMAVSLDKNNYGGAVSWLVDKMIGDGTRQNYSDYDYYIGRTMGDAISMLIGAGMTGAGVAEIVASITVGGSISVGSGGLLTAGGLSISIAGTAVGTSVVAYGSTVVAASANNMGGNFDNLKNEGKQIEVSKKDLKPLDDSFLKQNGIKAHDLKYEVLKSTTVRDKNISHYNIWRHPSTKELYVVPRSNNIAIPSGHYLP